MSRPDCQKGTHVIDNSKAECVYCGFIEPTNQSQTELDDILGQLMTKTADASYGEWQVVGLPEAKQAILDWHNKQVDEIVGGIESLELDDYDDTDPYQQGYMWAIGQAKTVVIEAERNKLKEQL